MSTASKLLKGSPLSPGIARGPAFVLGRRGLRREEGRTIDPRIEVERFRAALDRSEASLSHLRAAISSPLADAAGAILGAQQLMLRDPALVKLVEKRIREGGGSAANAVLGVVDELAAAIGAIEDPYLRERSGDVRDIGQRILAELDGGRRCDEEIPPGAVVVAHELEPSLAATLSPARVAGVVVETGAKASHATILLRAAGVPAVGAVAGAAETIASGSPILLDGISGLVFVAPGPDVEREYERLEAELREHQEILETETLLPAVTRDGFQVHLAANLGKSADTEAALRWNAESVGLFRTEFAFGIRDSFPTEDEQTAILSTVAERLHPRPIVFRLLDLGAEKSFPYFQLPATTNPALGLRGTRLLLEHPEILQPQLRAILRVAEHHDVSVLLPMVGGVDEVRAIRALIGAQERSLRESGWAANAPIPVGAMIEVPSTVLLADELARECDFLSLGSNDLAQYLLAADRDDPAMTGYYRVLHPAVLRSIERVVRAAARAGTELTICGEAAGDPFYAGLFLGLGLHRFSASPRQLGELRHEVRRLDAKRCHTLAKRLLRCATRDEVRAGIERADLQRASPRTHG